jgi:hypothetical protein
VGIEAAWVKVINLDRYDLARAVDLIVRVGQDEILALSFSV